MIIGKKRLYRGLRYVAIGIAGMVVGGGIVGSYASSRAEQQKFDAEIRRTRPYWAFYINDNGDEFPDLVVRGEGNLGYRRLLCEDEENPGYEVVLHGHADGIFKRDDLERDLFNNAPDFGQYESHLGEEEGP